MKKTSIAIILALVICFSAACNTGGSVESITLLHNNQTISNNALTANLSDGTLTFTANVTVKGSASKDFTLSSQNTAVATVEGKTVTLVSGGSTTLTAKATADESKTHSVTLTVVDDSTYLINVTGGTASKTSAAVGDTITLTVGTLPSGKVFDKWTAEPSSLTITDNTFTMPASNVSITATYVDAPEVSGIALKYNGEAISGNLLSVGLSLEEITFTADVTVVGGASTDFTLESSNIEVATVTGKKVALLKAGNTLITATAAGNTSRKHIITLTITDDVARSITVTGGTADKSTARVGETVTLTPAAAETGKQFGSWTIVPANVVITDNTFTMPAAAVTVTANFVDAPVGYGTPIVFSGSPQANHFNASINPENTEMTLDLGYRVGGEIGQNDMININVENFSTGVGGSFVVVFDNPTLIAQNVSVRFYNAEQANSTYITHTAPLFTVAAGESMMIFPANDNQTVKHMMIQLKSTIPSANIAGVKFRAYFSAGSVAMPSGTAVDFGTAFNNAQIPSTINTVGGQEVLSMNFPATVAKENSLQWHIDGLTAGASGGKFTSVFKNPTSTPIAVSVRLYNKADTSPNDANFSTSAPQSPNQKPLIVIPAGGEYRFSVNVAPNAPVLMVMIQVKDIASSVTNQAILVPTVEVNNVQFCAFYEE